MPTNFAPHIHNAIQHLKNGNVEEAVQCLEKSGLQFIWSTPEESSLGMLGLTFNASALREVVSFARSKETPALKLYAYKNILGALDQMAKQNENPDFITGNAWLIAVCVDPETDVHATAARIWETTIRKQAKTDPAGAVKNAELAVSTADFPSAILDAAVKVRDEFKGKTPPAPPAAEQHFG